ncbi:hypothetical protein [uncultured Bacteroides sp.]|uniref:tetratricopeptide repeat protein n=1 Tax=uncultured Bacteroides sp. TaxID=162156 RepID=UPI0026282BEE|nr:hypothetical protein [uncultured Bacteroides sp.]
MKQSIYIYITIIFFLIISGCSRSGKVNKQIPELVKAEKVMFDHPDSALHILESMEKPSSRTDKENHALWCLLVTQAKYKQMIKIKSDSLIHLAYHYYMSTDNARCKAMSALYMGGVNYNLGNVEESIKYYLEAKTEMEKTNDYKLGYLIMSGLGRIYLYRDLAEYSLDACQQAYDYAIKDMNVRYQMVSLQYLARCYCLLNNLNRAEQLYEQSSELALKLKNNNFYNVVQQELALVYIADKRYHKSLEIVKNLQPSSQINLLKGQIYLSLNKFDTAFNYLNKALMTDNIYTKRSVYKTMYQLTNFPKYQKYMREYSDSLLFYNDTIISLDKGKEIIAYKEKYNNEKLITEKQKLELEKSNVTYWWLLTIIFLLLFVFVFIYTLLHKRIVIHEKEEKLTKLALQLHEKELEVDKNESYILELQSQIEIGNNTQELLKEKEELLFNLKKENEQLCVEKKLLYEKMTSYSISSMEVTNVKMLTDKISLLEKREKELCLQILKQTPVLRNLHLKPVYLNESQLKEIRELADNVFQNFSFRLLHEIPTLSEHEILLCCLIKLRFSIIEISTFFNIASTSVSRSKLRIKNKICAELGQNLVDKSFDIWIWEY